MSLPSPIPHPRSTFAAQAAAVDRVVGGDWPEGDERALRGLSDQWHEAAKLIGPQLDDARRAVSGAVAAFGGADTRHGEALQRLWDRIDASVSADAFEELGALAAAGARVVEAAKLEIYVAVAHMLSELEILAAVSLATGGVSAACAEPVMLSTRHAITRVLDRAASDLHDFGTRGASANLGQLSYAVPVLAEFAASGADDVALTAAQTQAQAASAPAGATGNDLMMLAYGMSSLGAAAGSAAGMGGGGSRGTALRGRYGEPALRARGADVLSAVKVNVIGGEALAAKWPEVAAAEPPKPRLASREATEALSSLDNPKLASAEPASAVKQAAQPAAAAPIPTPTAAAAVPAPLAASAPAAAAATRAVVPGAGGSQAVSSATRAATASSAGSFTLAALSQPSAQPPRPAPPIHAAQPPPSPQPSSQASASPPSQAKPQPSPETSSQTSSQTASQTASQTWSELSSESGSVPPPEPFLLLMQAQAVAAEQTAPQAAEQRRPEPDAEDADPAAYERLIAEAVAGQARPGLAARQLPPVHQSALDGKAPERFGDLRGDWLRLIDAGGPAADPARATNSAEVARSLLDTWLHGRARVASTGTVQKELNEQLQRLRPDVQGLARVEAALRIEGHGACAVIVQEREHGERHAITIHNRHGELLYIDAQRKVTPVSTAPPATAGVVRLEAFALRADASPIDLTRGPHSTE